jgi:uncharacterized protein YjbI with pentapeptide repeats
MGIYDGLGFTEVNQEQGFTDKIYGTNISGTLLKITNITLAGSMVGGSVFSNVEEVTTSGTNFIAGTISGNYIYGAKMTAGSLVGVTNVTAPILSGTNLIGAVSGASVYGTNVVGGTGSFATNIYGTSTFSTLVSGTTGVFNTISGANAYSNTFSGTNIVGTNISGTNITNSNGLIYSTTNNSIYGAKIRAGSNALGADSGCWLSYGIEYTVYPTILLTNTKTEGALYVSGTPDLGSAFIAGKTASDTFNWLSIGV